MSSRRFPQITALALLLLVAVLASVSLSVNSATLAASQATSEHMIIMTQGRMKASTLMTPAGGKVVSSIPGQNIYEVELPKGANITDLALQYQRHPEIVFAHKDQKTELPELYQVSQGFPDQKDTVFISGVSPQSYYGQAGVYATGVDSAQSYATGSGVKVAVIDNGLDYSQCLIATADILPGYDFVDNDTIPAEEEGEMQSHGTFVTSLILLTAPDCSILPIRVFDGDGIGTQYDIAQGIYYAIGQQVDVINLSFGCETATPVLIGAVQAALNSGIVVVAASGNNGEDLDLYPAREDYVIAVGAIDTTEVRAGFSNYGNYLTVCAPGVDVHGAFFHPQYDWGIWSGTSFSTPIVTGTAALVRELQSGYDSDDVRTLLIQSARTELTWGTLSTPDLEYGYGLLNALDAVLEASGN